LMSDMDLAVKTEELELFLIWPKRTLPCETELSECLQSRCSLLMEGTFLRMTMVHTQVRDEI
jgi:predicted nucleotidyltransferase